MSNRWEIHWKDYYQVLQVHPTAEQEIIKAAYDRLARKYHPDVNQESSSTKRMIDINEAFEVLGNLDKRRLYHPVWLQKRRESNNRQSPPRTSTAHETEGRYDRPIRSTPSASALQFSNAQPIWHFILLSLVTASLYQFYWFYRNWKQLRLHEGWDISPGWRTAGLFIPILNIFLMYNQFRHIRDFARETGCDRILSAGWITIGWIFFNALIDLPDPFWLLALLSIWPLGSVQSVLNSYWEKKQPDLVVKIKLSPNQVALIVIGSIFLILVLIGIFMPEPFLETPITLYLN